MLRSARRGSTRLGSGAQSRATLSAAAAAAGQSLRAKGTTTARYAMQARACVTRELDPKWFAMAVCVCVGVAQPLQSMDCAKQLSEMSAGEERAQVRSDAIYFAPLWRSLSLPDECGAIKIAFRARASSSSSLSSLECNALLPRQTLSRRLARVGQNWCRAPVLWCTR